MIERIRLRNFQTHEDRAVAFGPGVTTIVGRTDAGKSAILRALRLVFTNQPAGDRYVRHGADRAAVRVWVDGRVLTRLRGTKLNAYELDGERFVSFSGDVPPEVAALANVSESNFQGQIDPPYWLTESPGQVGKALNAVVDLSLIDDVLAAAGRKAARLKADAAAAFRAKQDVEAKLKELNDWAELFFAGWNDIWPVYQEYRELSPGVALLGDLVARGTKATTTLTKAQERAGALQEVVAEAVASRKVSKEVAKLAGLVGQARKATVPPVPDIKPLLAVRSVADEVAESNRTLDYLIRDAREAEEDLCQAKQSLEAVTEEWKGLAGSPCPTCGQEMTSLPSSVPTFTSGTGHPSPGRRRATIGWKSRPAT
jgi:energy-coupling factor transporter ATP-binding protein EcfA2